MTEPPAHSRLAGRRHAVPLLLSSFPVPPSFIPPSPLNGLVNPPPSLPPSTPLPPLPGPSPITEQETLMFISAARQRRASKLSLASTSSRRNSAATIASLASGSNLSLPSLSPSASVTPLESSTRSLRSFSSNGSLSVPTVSASTSKISSGIEPRICEEDSADLTRLSLDDIPRTSPSPLPPGTGIEVDLESSDDERILEIGIPPSFSRNRIRVGLHDSISSIDMRDLPALQEDEIDLRPLTHFPKSPSLSQSLYGPPLSASSPTTRLSQSQIAVNRKAQPPVFDKELPPVPREEPLSDKRADSPDISTIIAKTPRVRRKSSTSTPLRSKSTSRSRSLRHVSDGSIAPAPMPSLSAIVFPTRRGNETRSQNPSRSPSKLPYAENEPWDDESFISDYGAPLVLDKTGTVIEISGLGEERMDRALDGDGSDSDSSIDIHTPLPHLMVRDGLLSPNSKLIAKPGRSPSPLPPVVADRLSIASTSTSVVPKSGVFKDERDTVRRRTRHRDGRLLKGGIGLTTGLGWSDSEDEDAPSPLTRRLSRLAVSRQSSFASLGSGASSRSHPLNRSYSETFSFGENARSRELDSRSSLPPTSWNSHSHVTAGVPKSRTTRTSTSSGGSGASRMSRASAASYDSSSSRRTSEATALGHINEKEEGASTYASSTSSASLATPGGSIYSNTGALRIRTKQSDINLKSALKMPSPSSTSQSTPAYQPSAVYATRTPVPRPLRLPQAQSPGRTLAAPRSADSIPRSPQPSPLLSGVPRSRNASFGVQSASAPGRPARGPVVAFPRSESVPQRDVDAPEAAQGARPRPKPRTGTGMTYRSTSSTAQRPSMLRMPSSNSLSGRRGADVGLAV